MQTNDYLEHWGILGMKWGRRRFQNQDGTLTSEGKVRYGSGTSPKAGQNGAKLSHKERKAKEKAAAERAKRLAEGRKKAAEEKAKKKAYEEEKEQALTKGKASDILKYRGDLTHDQMQRAITRLQDEDRLKELASKESRNDFQSRANKVAKTMGTMKELSNNAKDTVNNVRTIVDTIRKLSGDDGKSAKEKALQKIVDHGTAEEVEKVAYKLNGEQAKAAYLRLQNIENVRNKKTNETEYFRKLAEEKAAKIAEKNKKKASDDEGAIGIKGEKWATGQEKYLADYNFKKDVASNKNNMTYEDRERLRRAKISGVSRAGSSFKVRRTSIN